MITNKQISLSTLKMSAKNYQDFLCILLVFAFPISFLAIKHGVHISLYGIFLLGLFESTRKAIEISIDKKSLLIFLSLSSLLIATIVQQSITSNFYFAAWDGASRIFISGFVFLYLRQQNINYVKILEISIPLGMIALCVHLKINPSYYWGERWANSYVDPNSLGSQATILSMLCLLSITLSSKLHINILKIMGAVCGIYISIKAESRGGWMSVPIMSFWWLIIQLKETGFFNKKVVALKVVSATLLIICSIIAAATFLEPVNHRLLITIYEVTTWIKDPTIYSSAGSRMSMWVASLQLIGENPLGYGEIAIKDILAKHPLHQSIHLNGVKDMIAGGPHSDILSKGLSLGLLGIASYFITIFMPAFLFASKIKSNNIIVNKAAKIGLIYLSGVFTVGLFNEALSLKYLCSFYGLMIACLAADVLKDNSCSSINQKRSLR